MQIGLEQIRAIRREEKKRGRKRKLILLFIIIGIVIVYLCVQGRGVTTFNPIYVARSILNFIRYKFTVWTGSETAQAQVYNDIFSTLGNNYAVVIKRLQSLLLLFISGAVLALSGTVYQTSMRNPMAVPTMLGVSSGVNMAQMMLVILYAEEAYNMGMQRYILSYGISIGVLVFIMIAGKLIGGKHFNVADLLIVGTVVNRLFQTIMNYVQSGMDTETLQLYQEFSQESQDYFNDFSDLGILILVSVIVLAPLILMRFAFNVVSFLDEEAYSVGVSAKFMRFYGIFAGGILTATAMIHAGNIGMLATVIPLLCRYLYGADFRVLLATTAAWGGVVLVFANLVRGFTYINEYQIPLGNIISLLAIPFLIWIISKQKKAWSMVE